MYRFLRDIKKYRSYILYRTKAELLADVAGSRLGCIWWVLEPFFMMLFYFLLFQLIINKKQTYATAYIYIGFINFFFFRNCLNHSLSLIKKNKGIISKIYISKYVLAASDLLTKFAKLCFSIPLVILLMIYYRVPLTWHILEIIPLLMLEILLTFSFYTIFMHLGAFVQDLNKVSKPFMRVLMYMSGVIFPIRNYLEGTGYEWIVKINPLAFLLENIRNCVLYGIGCNWWVFLVWMIFGIVLLRVGIFLIHRNEKNYVKVV